MNGKILAAVILLMTTSAHAQVSIKGNGQWIATKSGCKLWNPSPQPNETVEWSGDCKGGYTSGRGVVTWYQNSKRGNIIECVEQNGRCIGNTKVTYPDGSTYFGTLSNQDGLPEGQGTYTFANGGRYVGEFKDGMKNGQGTDIYANGAKYVGEWKDGKENGQGTYIGANGGKYVGEFKDNKRDGQGTVFGANGDKFVGEWKDDKKDGQGTYVGANGNKYVGEYKDDRFNGQGTMTIGDGQWRGSKLVGEFKDDKPVGRTYILANDRKCLVEIKDGELNGPGICYAANGSIISQGIYQNGKLTNAGTAKSDAGDIILRALGGFIVGYSFGQALTERPAPSTEQRLQKLERESWYTQCLAENPNNNGACPR